MSKHVLCRVDDLEVGRAQRFVVESNPICLARCSAGFYAIDDTCSHEDFSLAEGEVDPETCEIECWKHGTLFSLVSGKPETLPATMPVRVYEVSVENEEVSVSLP